jgi:hypothetical protein
MYLNSKPAEKLQVQQWLISATLPAFNHLQARDGSQRSAGISGAEACHAW